MTNMALPKTSGARLDLRAKQDAARSKHAEEFLSRLARIEQKKGLLKGLEQADGIKLLEKEKGTARETKKPDKEMSTELRLDRQRSQKIKDLKGKIQELEMAINNIKQDDKEKPKTDPPLASDGRQEGSQPARAEADKKEQVKRMIKFPDGFLWGTATSAYQIEGGIVNNWSQWEGSAKRTAALKRRRLDPDDYVCGQACDSYNRYEEDFKLAKRMNNNAIRLGIEWARVQPRSDTWEVEAIEHYRQMLKTAKKMGLTTFVTLWHWTVPRWFAQAGSWEKTENIDAFLRYVDLVIKELGADIDYWVVLNEPLMHVFGSYLKAYHPPQKRSLFKAEKVFNNLIRAHKESYRLIHEYFPDASVGCANLLNYFEAADKWNPLERLLARAAAYFWNERFLEKTKKCHDYIGVNYYFHDRIIWYPPFRHNKNEWVNDNGWEICPEGIYHVLKFAAKYNKPIFITENGLSDQADEHRARFIREHLRSVHRAIAEGVDVQGYLHWSLIDNFEWAYGWKLKFGLYEVDRKTFERKPRPSAEYYARIARENAVEEA